MTSRAGVILQIMSTLSFLYLLCSPLLLLTLCGAAPTKSSGSISQKVLDEIISYQDVVEEIVNYSLSGPGQNQSYDRLAAFTDAFGSRLSGTDESAFNLY